MMNPVVLKINFIHIPIAIQKLIQEAEKPASLTLTAIETDRFEEPSKACNLFFVQPEFLSQEELDRLFSQSRPESRVVLIQSESSSNIPWNQSKLHDVWDLNASAVMVQFKARRLFEEIDNQCRTAMGEQYFNVLLESTPNMIWIKNQEGIHLRVNKAFCKVVGKERDDVEGRDHNYIWNVSPEEASGFDCNASDRMVMESGQMVVKEEIVKAGNDLKILTTYKSPLYSFDGSIFGTIGMGIDITQERAYREEIIQKNKALNTIFGAMDCGIVCHTLDGTTVLNCNSRALSILGYDSVEQLEEFQHGGIAENILQEDRGAILEALEHCRKTKDPVNIEYRVRHHDGSIHHVMGTIKIVEENGTPFFQRFLLDCTEQKLQEQKTKLYHHEFLHALCRDYSYVGFINLAGRITPGEILVSALNDSLLGETQPFMTEQFQGYHLDMMPEEDRHHFKDVFMNGRLEEELQDKQVYYLNFRLCKEDQVYYYQIKAVRSGIWNEKEKGVVIGVRSINDEIRTELERRSVLEHALEQATSANRAKTIFLSNMSHDIRTPMNAILGFTQLAEDHIHDQKRVLDYLTKIRSSGSVLLKLINDILDMSSIESGQFHLTEETFQLKEVISHLRNLFARQAEEKNIHLSFYTRCLDEDRVICDQLRLNQALTNILSNAMKYTPDGGEVSLTLRRSSSLIEGKENYIFIVEDDGVGMSPDFLEKIYDQFSRERSSTSSGIQGTGLGMAITKNIVDAMGGYIRIDSIQQHGTRVIIILPLKHAEAIPVYRKEDPYQPRLTLQEMHSHQKMRSNRILLVEDNELNQEIAVAILEDAGLEVDVANNGLQAVEMITQSDPWSYGLVLMDVQMPVMDGYTATRQIRKLSHPGLASVPIVAMTANAFEEDKKDAMEAGMDGHIAKPIDPDVLIETISSMTGYAPMEE